MLKLIKQNMLNFCQNKKGVLVFSLFLTFCLFFLNVSFIEAIRAEIDWPELPGGLRIEDGEGSPGNLTASLPELIRYIFNFAIAIAGLIAFIRLVYGGFRYLTSAGNVAAQRDARDILTSAIIGLLLLLASVLLLRIINPDVLILRSDFLGL